MCEPITLMGVASAGLSLFSTGKNLLDQRKGAGMLQQGAVVQGQAARLEAQNKIETTRTNALVQSAILDLQDFQVGEQIRDIAVAAREQETERMAQAEAVHAQNIAFIASSGVAENMSYDQGIAHANKDKLRRDLSATEANAAGQTARLADQIRVNKIQRVALAAGVSQVERYAPLMADYAAKGATLSADYKAQQATAFPGPSTIAGIFDNMKSLGTGLKDLGASLRKMGNP